MSLVSAVPARLALLALLGAAAACGGGAARGGEARDSASPATAVDSARLAAACPPDSAGAAAADADVAIVATVRARSVRHAERPRTRVSFPGAGARDTLSCDERTHLERPVRPGRTYRDVEVRYRLHVRLDTALARAMGDSAGTAPRDTARRP